MDSSAGCCSIAVQRRASLRLASRSREELSALTSCSTEMEQQDALCRT